MKKASIITAICLIICLLFTGCGETSGDIKDTPDSPAVQEETNPAEETGEPDGDGPENAAAELAVPVLEWCDLYNPNGIDTVTGVIFNPNDIAVDVDYDLVYLKDGTEVARSEGFYTGSILPQGRQVVWANFDIPPSEDADEVRMENAAVYETYYAPIDGSWEYAETVDGEVYFDFSFESTPELANITFVLYNDNDGNGKCGSGEIVVTSTDSLTEQTGRVSFSAEGYAYTDYEVFFTAY